eukprot:11178314-Lingulodinium_polyedra.AAC.1
MSVMPMSLHNVLRRHVTYVSIISGMVICTVGSLRSSARNGGGTMFRAFFPMATAPKPALRKEGAVERRRAAWGRAP